MLQGKKKKLVLWIVVFFIVAAIIPLGISSYMVTSMDKFLITGENFDEIAEKAAAVNADCILVLGAGLKEDGTPNYMLQDRLDTGLALYHSGVAPKLLLSGDNGQENYDEVNAMKRYVLERGVPLEDIFLDHAGFSTYESMYRTKAIFDVKKVIVVTQKYHQYRALYTGNGLGLTAYGIVSEPRIYAGQKYRDLREILARNKDFAMMIWKPEPTYLGDVIPINGSGLATQD